MTSISFSDTLLEVAIIFDRSIVCFLMIFSDTNYTLCVKGVVMNYKEWSDQYLSQACAINHYIKKLKTQKAGTSLEEERILNYRISVLYKMYLETKNTAEYLKSCERRDSDV